MRELLHVVLKRLETRWFVYAVIGVGVLLRIAVLLYLGRFPLGSDALVYHEMALSILHGEDFSPYYPPGLPQVLAFVYRLLGESELVGRATSLVWYVIFSVVLYRLAGTIFTRKVANLTVLAFAIFPAFVWQSIEPLTQLPTATCLLAIVYLTLLA